MANKTEASTRRTRFTEAGLERWLASVNANVPIVQQAKVPNAASIPVFILV